eukprot:gnl/TRDRNA2_/TRDRNA2_176844_c1_seq20.p1 gnl/TRDRNA2_/TRDRNA2_176844_c1~~gnl/TRDRNA2_/TRDRNA2_176844_c1_seq20.p1  ORF type:complete len:486 (+),score=102.07 gnl/TRDRNA2_/TRDRNA2_176844_c1_seq20:146-1603(+)
MVPTTAAACHDKQAISPRDVVLKSEVEALFDQRMGSMEARMEARMESRHLALRAMIEQLTGAIIELKLQSSFEALTIHENIDGAEPRVQAKRQQKEKTSRPLDLTFDRAPLPPEEEPSGPSLVDAKQTTAAQALQTEEPSGPALADGEPLEAATEALQPQDAMEDRPPFATMKSGFIPNSGGSEQVEEQSEFRQSQKKAEALYTSVYVQVFVAGLIVANFITNMIEKQIDPKSVLYTTEFEYFELGYNIAFTIELIFNMYAYWPYRFWRSGWNIFDFAVVSIGIFMSLNLPLPPSLSLLRMIRAFRVFRLFKRVKNLNKIIVALVRAVPGVMNAFLIQAITMCIFSILAVEFYQNIGKVCDADGICGPCSNEYITSRGDCIGDEYFGSFLKSLYTFFQVLTGDSWSEAVARPIMWWMDQPVLAFFTAMFFSCYILVAAVVLINVVVAVLLDKMGEPLEDEETPGDEGKQDDETLGTSTRKPKQTS